VVLNAYTLMFRRRAALDDQSAFFAGLGANRSAPQSARAAAFVVV
jgi:hypothetical protein